MKKIIITQEPWLTRIAILREQELQNMYFSSPHTDNFERSYFKGVVTKVLPGIQTAFVDIGKERAGFLHISEIDRELAIERMTRSENFDEDEEIETLEKEPVVSHKKPDISKILHEGETILVQVSKEPVYEKGAKLTTCFTLPGRFLVLMPNIPRIGISKKIDSKEERQRLRDLLIANLPEGMGAIIRTASAQHPDKEILQDLTYLVQTWNFIQDKFRSAKPLEKIYEDIDLVLQVVRDNLDDDVDQVICDNETELAKVTKFIKSIAPEHAHKAMLYKSSTPLFAKFDIEKQLEQALQNKVYLKSGGSLIIETAQAMTVIDVNTGRYTGGDSSLEETILKTNLEAAEEIVRQLRLRNIGGLIVIDFIDMASHNNRQRLYRYIEKTLRERDKFQSVVLRVSEFGLVQMTRKRSGKTLMQQMMRTCLQCHGSGVVKSVETQAYQILRKLREDLEAHRFASTTIMVKTDPVVLQHLTTVEYNAILWVEKTYNCSITLVSEE
jgi:ribonuclease G